MKKLLRELFGSESFIGMFTEGDLSQANIILSCLKWPLDEK
ncbi:MAG: hypothetical protein ACFFAS_09110 [Promethearchaeota archaeon]